jgi:hypothetical protein
MDLLEDLVDVGGVRLLPCFARLLFVTGLLLSGLGGRLASGLSEI